MAGVTEGEEAATGAPGSFGACVLGMAVQQGMILLEKSCVGREVVVKQCLVLVVVATQVHVEEPKPTDDPASVRINNERRFVGGVKDYVVGGLRAYAVDAQKLFP